MIRTFSIRGVICCAMVVMTASAVSAQSLDEALAGLKTYKFGDSRLALGVVEEAAINARHDAATKEKLEAAFIALLKTDASIDARRFVCRELEAMGSGASVETLAGLIAEADIADYAIWALIAIPDDSALTALMTAASEGPQTQRVNVIHGIARRGSEDAVAGLITLSESPDKPRLPHSAASVEKAVILSWSPSKRTVEKRTAFWPMLVFSVASGCPKDVVQTRWQFTIRSTRRIIPVTFVQRP